MAHSSSTAVTTFGQVFTPPSLVERMVELRRNFGTLLDPCCGQGAFLKPLTATRDTITALDIDGALIDDARLRYPHVHMHHRDFFAYPCEKRFDTIIANPPYVRFQDIPATTQQRLPDTYDKRTNLYVFFIDKCLNHLKPNGELIFITPRHFIKATHARPLNERLVTEGAFTHFIELGDAPLFPHVNPTCAIWRWQKNRKQQTLHDGTPITCQHGHIAFSTPQGRLGDSFSVKVGAVSGADTIFTDNNNGCTDFVCSRTHQHGTTRRMIYNRFDPCLLPHKNTLLQRRIRPFHEQNWWQWGRLCPHTNAPRLYVNCKTRTPRPFFTHPAKAWDGAVLALFPHNTNCDLEKTTHTLNNIPWHKHGFIVDGRFLFTQRSLENANVML
ncbi:MAG: N-6 DNA methylase [Alphaproteobacteria bacterium GM202ARS2]|nr:N-6 DNA methylase [Alphaproteobacteria bacterium GM202ARS2]